MPSATLLIILSLLVSQPRIIVIRPEASDPAEANVVVHRETQTRLPGEPRGKKKCNGGACD